MRDVKTTKGTEKVSRLRASVSNIAVVLVTLGFGVAVGQGQGGSVQTLTVIDTLSASRYLAERQAHRLTRTQLGGVRARLNGISERPPATIYVTDTLTTIPDTVLVFVSVRQGTLTTEMLVATDSTESGERLVAPEIHVGSDISDCDEGFEVSANGVQCDRARLGHLYAYAEASSTPSLGIYWEPSYRSPWTLSAGHTGSEWVFTLRRGWRLF